ncbi:hypothetical protein [Myxococcus sp. CA039A]|uniref:hypothetical protein n=1 Tax=Myxococcus sp. CA039A TaxID=2741737 RepID=UPI00157ACB33|nr:hypothetical protein [Myxococcus sp. CA039A]NTX52236.1 hypothetical protein [Myxococcus sp. CA039A]
MANLLDLIGESAPYVHVYDLVVDNGVLHSRFKPEQQRYGETTLMSCSEALRTLAVHGVLTCAAANPSQGRHYYLAARAELQVFPIQATTSGSFHCVGRVERIEQRKQFPYFKATTTCFTEDGERYAVMDGECIALPEAAFVAIKGADASPVGVRAPGQPSPYRDPVRPMKLEWTKPGEVLRAELEGFPREDFVGHFDVRALCPLSLLAGNAFSLLRHFPGFDAYRISKCLATCKDVPLPGEPMLFNCIAEAAGQFKLTAENGQGKHLAAFHLEARPDSHG